MGIHAACGRRLDPEQAHLHCPHPSATGTGWTEGWRLTSGAEELGREGALACGVEAPSAHVLVGSGVAWVYPPVGSTRLGG